MKDVSIIIPTYNRPEVLEMVLPYYFMQEDILEIIIVDDGSNLSYEKIIQQYHSHPSINFIYHKNIKNGGAAYSRNIGISLASGKYILWGEDDAFLAQDYVKVLKEKMSEKKIVFGSIYYGILPEMDRKIIDNSIRSQQSAKKELFNFKNFEAYYRLKTENDIEVPWGHALIMLPRKAYDNVKYFEGYEVNGYREETDAQVQMTQNGYSIIYTSETCCYHLPSNNQKGGQHNSGIIIFEYYKFKNNNIFLNRHYDFLKKRYKLEHSITWRKVRYLQMQLVSLFIRCFNKIKRKVVK